jgi:hypothetical protein
MAEEEMAEEEERAALQKKFEEGVAELQRQAMVLSDMRERCIQAGIRTESLPPDTTVEDCPTKRGEA